MSKSSSPSLSSTLDPDPDAVTLNKTPEGISILTLNRQRKRNAVNPPTAQKLYDSFLAFEQDDTQKVCVFHGAHGTFCAGFDLHELSKQTNDAEGSDNSARGIKHPEPVNGSNIAPMGLSRMQIAKPVICVVSGHAVAGGLELSLLADMRIVEEDAIFGVFCRRFGVPLIDGGTVRLQAVVGLGRALDMILTGRAVGAQEALMMGLANRVVPKGKGLEEAMGLARQLVEFPQLCMVADRASCYYAAYEAKSLEDAMANEFDQGIKVVDEESVKGAMSFSAGAGRGGTFGSAKTDGKL